MPSPKTKKSPSLEDRLDPLRKLIKKSREKTRPATPEEKKELFDYLDARLRGLDLAGRVVSLLVYDTVRGLINCYGEYIPPETIFNRLNLTTGTHGSRLTGTIAYPELPHLTSYHRGYFVPGKLFHLKEKDQGPKKYVALVNIKVDPDSDGVPYQPSPRFKPVRFT